MNGVARGNKLAIDSENGGEFLQLSTILKDNSFQNNSIVAIKGIQQSIFIRINCFCSVGQVAVLNRCWIKVCM